MRRLLILLIKIFLSAGLIWYAFSNVDVGAAMTYLRGIPSAAVVAALALLFLTFIMGALRLRLLLLLLGGRCTVAKAIDVVMIGAFFSQALISFVGGDAMRIWRLVQAKTPLGVAAKGIFFDRVSGFSGLIAIILFSLPWLLDVISHSTMRVGLIGALIAAIVGILAVFLTDLMPVALRRWKAFRWFAELSHVAFTILRSKSRLLLLAGLSVGIHLLNVLVIYLIARGLELDVSGTTMLVLFPPVFLLSLLPISVAGWGVREGAMVVALGLVGIPAYQSLALSICFGLCVLAISLPGGVLWFVSRRKIPADEDARLGLGIRKY